MRLLPMGMTCRCLGGGSVLPGRREHGFIRRRKTFRSASRESFPSAMNETMPTTPGVCFLAHLLGSSSPRKLGKEDALNSYSDCWGAARAGWGLWIVFLLVGV